MIFTALIPALLLGVGSSGVAVPLPPAHAFNSSLGHAPSMQAWHRQWFAVGIGSGVCIGGNDPVLKPTGFAYTVAHSLDLTQYEYRTIITKEGAPFDGSTKLLDRGHLQPGEKAYQEIDSNTKTYEYLVALGTDPEKKWTLNIVLQRRPRGSDKQWEAVTASKGRALISENVVGSQVQTN